MEDTLKEKMERGETLAFCADTEGLAPLVGVRSPLRYAGGEPGEIRKNPLGKLTFCLAFPDLYEIGMSHTGYRVLYTELNKSPLISCERFFAPAPDALSLFGKSIFVTLENKLPLESCDILGFSVQYELAYTTLLQIISRSGIPLLSCDRKEGHPLVIAGGSSVMNPVPLSPFIDAFFLGEADDSAPLFEELHSLTTRTARLERLEREPYIYIPALNPHKKTQRRVFDRFSNSSPATAPLIPLTEVVQDRVTLEIARGCTAGCRFCQAGVLYRPLRERSAAALHTAACEGLAATGHLEASLLSLDSGDYSEIEPLLLSLSSELTPRHISLALPSLRAETVGKELLARLSAVRKSSFTIAPEAGTQRLRDIINKNLNEEDILKAARHAKEEGIGGAKLYFMCGLPFETDEDILGIAELVKKIRAEVKRGRFFEITVSVSNFVPKPFTPFEREGQASEEELLRKHRLLKDSFRDVKAKLKLHNIFMSRLEGALSRGGERWWKTLKKAHDEGFYLDAWGEYFSREKWNALLEEVAEYAVKNYGAAESTPWWNMGSGVEEAWLQRERERAAKGETTPDCRKNKCSQCGVCDFKERKNTLANSSPQKGGYDEVKAQPPTAFRKYILTYARTETAALFSALDTSRIFSHLLLACGVTLKFSEGFNPSPKIISVAPLPVGAEGDEETLLFEGFVENPLESVAKLNAMAPKGLNILSLKLGWRENISNLTASYQLDEESYAFLRDSKKSYGKVSKKGEAKLIRLSDYLLSQDDTAHTLTIKITPQGSFHFPEFFRQAEYGKIPKIKRIRLSEN